MTTTPTEACSAAHTTEAVGSQVQRVVRPGSGARRFAQTYCSQCGEAYGPGDAGYSSCNDHTPRRNKAMKATEPTRYAAHAQPTEERMRDLKFGAQHA